MEVLEKMFGSAAKVKIMRLFLFNPNTPFDMEKVVARVKITDQAARLNLKLLESAHLIRPRAFVREVKKIIEPKKPKPAKIKKGKKGKGGKSTKDSRAHKSNSIALRAEAPRVVMVKRRVRGWVLNENFTYLTALQSFLVQASPLQDQNIARKLNRTGKIKLLIISGVFIQEKDSRVDILVVGDNLRRSAIDSAIKDMEAELGKDIIYSVFETTDFQYRLGMYDKLIRDILDYPHKKLVNKLGL